MKNPEINLVFLAITYVLILATGIYIHRQGAPFKTGPVTVHKLIALAFVTLSVFRYLQIYRSDWNQTVNLLILGGTALFILLAIGTGAFLSSRNTSDLIMLGIHRVSTAGIFVSSLVLILRKLSL